MHLRIDNGARLFVPFFRDLTKVKDSSKYLDPLSTAAGAGGKKEKKIKAVKNLNVLSFGDEEGDAAAEAFTGELHSSHDSKQKSSKLSSKTAVDQLGGVDPLASLSGPALDSASGGTLVSPTMFLPVTHYVLTCHSLST